MLVQVMPDTGLTNALRETEPWSLPASVLAPGKVFTDPVHGDVHLNTLEVAIVDTPAYQRLRRVRQLGMTHLVYPGAVHTRFSHGLGAVRVAQMLLDTVWNHRAGLHATEDLFAQWEREDRTRAQEKWAANGNQTAGGGASALAYNAANQTTSITPSGGTALSLAYAGNDQGERTNAGPTSYTNTILGLGSETRSASTYYTRDNKGSLLGQRTPQGRYYYLLDGLGSVVAVTGSTGAVVSTYKYDPYGKQTSTTGTIANPWRFAGQYYDATTGLYKMGQRYYNPANARWTQQDPIRQIADQRQSDRYPYAGDDPINITDPNGTFWDTVMHVGLTAESTVETLGLGSATLAVGGSCVVGSAGMATPVCAGITAEGAGMTTASAYVTYHEWDYWFK